MFESFSLLVFVTVRSYSVPYVTLWLTDLLLPSFEEGLLAALLGFGGGTISLVTKSTSHSVTFFRAAI